MQVVYPLGMTHTAMRAMSQARHVGKIVAQASGPSISARASGLTIIPGGLGAVGAIVGTHLAAQAPCTHLALLGRSGRLGKSTRWEGADMLQKSGAEVIIAHCDASDRAEVGGLMQYLSSITGSRAKPPSLTGLIQSGGVLEDAMLKSVNLRVSSWALSLKSLHCKVYFSAYACPM